MRKKLIKNKPIKIVELFAGIGAFSKALKKLEIDNQILFISEINKKAIAVFEELHFVKKANSKLKNLGDILQITEEQLIPFKNDCDVLCFGSPCQDFSQAGNNKGGVKNSGTRSSLLWEAFRIIEFIKPKVVIFENVKNLQLKHRPVLDKFRSELQNIGYEISFSDLINALDWGIPQNRPRYFLVAYNKKNFNSKIWSSFENKIRSKTNKKWPTLGQFLGINDFKKRNLIKDLEQKEIFNFTNFVSWRDNKGNKNGSYNRAWKIDRYSGSVTYSGDIKITDNNRHFSKLTAEESWLLMGFSKTDYQKAVRFCTEGQLKSLAGNSVVVNVLEGIVRNLPLNKLS